MEHAEAFETNAPDRYLLGQLSAAEADAFEEHYFDCTTCAEEVRLGMSFMEAGRRLVRETREPAAPPAPATPVVPIASDPRRRRGFRWIPAAAVAAILAIPVNFGLLMRMQNAVPRMILAGPTVNIEVETRGPGATAETTTIGTNQSMNFQLPPAYSKFEVQITDAAGKSVYEETFATADLEDGLSVGPIQNPGTYQLVIVGEEPNGKFTEVDRRQVEVQARGQ